MTEHVGCVLGAALGGAFMAFVAVRMGFRIGYRHGRADKLVSHITADDIERLGGVCSPKLPDGSIRSERL